MKSLSNSAAVKAAIGAPIKAGLVVRGVVQDSTAAGYAILAVPVIGPAGKGTLYVVANRVGSDWDMEREVLQLGAGPRRIDLTPPTQQEHFHYPATGHVYLLPLDAASSSDLKDLPAYYKARLGLDVSLLPTQKLAPDTLDQNRKQVIAEKALLSMAKNQPEMAEDMDSVLIGVTSQDMNFQSLNLRYANNFRSGRFSIISTARLHAMPWYAGDNPEVFAVRTRKMVTRSLALLHYPVNVSSDVTSAVTSNVYTVLDIDEMGESLGRAGRQCPFRSFGSSLCGYPPKPKWEARLAAGLYQRRARGQRIGKIRKLYRRPAVRHGACGFFVSGGTALSIHCKYRPKAIVLALLELGQ